jgi:hypothetical protein
LRESDCRSQSSDTGAGDDCAPRQASSDVAQFALGG